MRLFPIRHHGPGSARSLLTAFEDYRPDAVLIEGPPDADALLELAADAGMQPPVALVLYPPDEPRKAVYYPFASFSPEWVALRWALQNGVPVRFMDLPQRHQLGREPDEPDLDPLTTLAEMAGFEDGERWWEFLVEQRGGSGEVFEAITEAMGALREGRESPPREALREAWMRRTIRETKAERLAVVCGAWHAPALGTGTAKADDKLLKGLPKTRVEATWVPWTFQRLAFASGYGAGVESPEYYTLVWETPPEKLTVHWMSRAARLLRDEDLSVSTASSVEAVRLAETLASLRGLPLAGLQELMEAAEAVFCTGVIDGPRLSAPMHLIRERLVVGERLGAVPPEAPTVPLARDLEKLARSLRLKQEAAFKDFELDLRKPNDLERSRLLHRLALLEVEWGVLRDSRGVGTFRETWRLEWKPELAVHLIAAAVWGNTVEGAASARARHDAGQLDTLPELTELADQVLLAELSEPLDEVLQRLESMAAVAADLGHLMDSLPRIARMLRYPGVRGTDVTLLEKVLDSLVGRITVGLPLACASLDDEAANDMLRRLIEVDQALESHRSEWQAALAGLAEQAGLHGLVAGRAVWILLDRGQLTEEEVSLRLSRALSEEPSEAAAWVEGLLRGNGALLVHTEGLFRALDGWVGELSDEAFQTVLPLARRTFSTFSPSEKRQLGERARHGRQLVKAPSELDEERAAKVLPVLRLLLGEGMR